MLYPSRDTCVALARFHPQLRLAWRGENHAFALLQLYHPRDAAGTYRDRWTDAFGPTFTKKGRVGRDWDFWGRVPAYLTDIPPELVNDQAIVALVRSRWARPLAARVEENRRELGKDLDRRIKDLGADAGKDLWKRSQSGETGSHAPVVAKKFHERSDRFLAEASGEANASEHFMPRPPPGGWEKHRANDKGDDTDLGSL